jgi:hypothetical protein
MFYNVNNVYDLFTNVAGDTILKMLKEINLYTWLIDWCLTSSEQFFSYIQDENI